MSYLNNISILNCQIVNTFTIMEILVMFAIFIFYHHFYFHFIISYLLYCIVRKICEIIEKLKGTVFTYNLKFH